MIFIITHMRHIIWVTSEIRYQENNKLKIVLIQSQFVFSVLLRNCSRFVANADRKEQKYKSQLNAIESGTRFFTQKNGSKSTKINCACSTTYFELIALSQSEASICSFCPCD